jgi:sensor domain CHASE-containing protein
VRDWVLFLHGSYEIRALTIRLRTPIIVALTSVELVVVPYGALRFVLLGQFIAIELARARENVQRVRSALDDDLESIDRQLVFACRSILGIGLCGYRKKT